MKRACMAVLLLVGWPSCSRTLMGTPYSAMNCSQFVCIYTRHRPSTARELFEEGQPISHPLASGDIVAFAGRHVAVFDGGGLIDSLPERGVARVADMNPKDPWYSGPITVIRKAER